MFRTEPSLDRSSLGFTEEVLSAFNFLIEEYGFRCVKAEPTFVRYESPRVFVNIYHGRSSYELGVEIGQLAGATNQEEPFSISEVIELAGAQEETGYTFFQASTAERIRRFVPKLAEYVRKYAAAALIGDPITYDALREIQWRRSEMYLKEMRLSQIRPEADRAWRAKDYVRLVKLYSSIQESLTPSERKRLEYARKHL